MPETENAKSIGVLSHVGFDAPEAAEANQ